jgi:hypothetical protein
VTDREFFIEVRKGLMIVMRAMMRRFGLSWLDFLPKELASSLTIDTSPNPF